MQTPVILFGKTVHCLGGDNGSPFELLYLSQIPWIRSNDTSAPVQYGLKKVRFSLETGYAERFVGEKPDLENSKERTTNLLKRYKNDIMHNIVVFFNFISRGSHLEPSAF